MAIQNQIIKFIIVTSKTKKPLMSGIRTKNMIKEILKALQSKH